MSFVITNIGGNKMEQNEFNDYLRNRYYKQRKWYSEHSRKNKKYYMYLQGSIIILSAFTTVLIAIGLNSSPHFFVKLIPVITSMSITILVSILTTFKYQENWINYRTTSESLKKEIHYYKAGIGDYSTCTDEKALFIERVENLISRENTIWVSTHKEQTKTKDIEL